MKYTSKQNFILRNQVDKRFIFQNVAANFKDKIPKAHVISVLNLLISEILQELLCDNTIKIGNFVTLSIMNYKPRKRWDLIAKKTRVTGGNRYLKFKLNKKIKKELNKFFGDLK